MTRTSRNVMVGLIVTVGLAGIGWTASADPAQSSTVIVQAQDHAQVPAETLDRTRTRRTASEVLDWNQIFIDTLIATNTANSSSQRLGAIVHTAIFDAYNGIERRYTPIFVHDRAPQRCVAPSGGHRCGVHGAGRPVPVPTAGAGCQLCGFAGGAERRMRGRRPIAQTPRSCATRIERGIAWGTEVAQAVLAWRATDGFSASYPAVHRWHRGRPVAADTAGVRSDERPGVGIHRDVRPGQQHPVRAWTTARSDQRHVHGRFQRRQGARSQDRIDAHRGPDGARSCSGRATPASTGIRQRTRLRAPTTCRCPTATGCSRS